MNLRIVGGEEREKTYPDPSIAQPAPTAPTAPTAPDQQRLAFQAAELANLAASADTLSVQSRAASTRQGYRTDFAHFRAWCAQQGLEALPAEPETVRLYLAAHGQPRTPGMLKVKTLERRLVAIADEHRACGLEPPTHTDAIRKVFAGIRRAQARDGISVKKAKPLVLRDLRAVVRKMPTARLALWPVRDRVVLLLGFAAALRRSEIVALNVADVEIRDGGMAIRIRTSKTDQTGEGEYISVPYAREEDVCPIRSYQAWLTASGITSGPIFRPIDRHGNVSEKRLTDRSINDIVKSSVDRAGLGAAGYSGHSMRAGFITTAAESGVDRKIIARTTRHKSTVVLEGYIRQVDLFENTAAALFEM